MIGVALGLVAALTTGSACRLATVVFVGTVATTILLAADIAFQGHAVLASLGGSRLLKLAGIVAAFAITFGLVWLLRGGMSRIHSSEPSRYLPHCGSIPAASVWAPFPADAAFHAAISGAACHLHHF